MVFARRHTFLFLVLAFFGRPALAQHFETGQVFIDASCNGLSQQVIIGNWEQVTFADAFSERPVVIVGPISQTSFAAQADEASFSIRVRNITSTGFQVSAQHPDGVSRGGLNLNAYWVAMPPGMYTLQDGTKIEAFRAETEVVRASGVVGGNSIAIDGVAGEHVFTESPAVFHTINSHNDTAWITTMVLGASLNSSNQVSISFALEGAEVTGSHGAAEDVGFIVVQPNFGTVTDTGNNTLAYDIGTTIDPGDDDRVVSGHNTCTRIPNDRNLEGMSATPHAVASKLSSNGPNGGWLRRCFANESPFNDVTTAGVYVHVEEDQENDEERNHTQEKASFFTVEPGAPIPIVPWEAVANISLSATDESGNTSIPEGSVLKAGERIKLTVVLSNEGPTDISSGEYTDFIVSVPSGTQYVANTVESDVGTADVFDNIIYWDGDLDSGDSAEISFLLELQQLPHGSSIEVNGTWFYDTTGNGDTDSKNSTFSFSTQNYSGANSSITFSEDPIPADGQSTTTVQFTLRDSYGNNVAGGVERFQATEGTFLGNLESDGAGVFSQTLQSSTAVGTSAVTVLVQGSFLDGGAQTLLDGLDDFVGEVDFVAGLPSAVNSSIDTNPDVLVADGVSLVTVLISLRDSNDQPVLDYVDSIQIDTTLGTELFPIGDLGGGLYEAFIIASTEAGTATVTVRPDGASFDLRTQVTFTPGEVDLSRCTIEASPSEIPTGGSNSTITVRVADTFDNPIAGQDVAIVNIPVDLNVSNITDNGDGTYTATLTSGTAAQTVQLGFTVNNSTVADARTTVTFTAAEASMGLSTISASPNAATVNSQTILTVALRDNANQPIDQAAVTISVSPDNGGGLLGSIDNVGGGNYQQTWLAPTVTGVYTASFQVNGVNFPNEATITVTPGAPVASASTLIADPAAVVGDNTDQTILRLVLQDQYGNGVPGESGNFSVAGLANYSFGPLLDNGDGSYSATFQAEGAGAHSITFTHTNFTKSVFIVLIDPSSDLDGDGISNEDDNCPLIPNAEQADADNDDAGDLCDDCPEDDENDVDGDGICGSIDNCPTNANADQADADSDDVGDACDPCPSDIVNDEDGDGVCGSDDNCPQVANENQLDSDGDQTGDACDSCPNDPLDDADADGHCADADNCPEVANPTQSDANNNNVGDACEPNDSDGDGIVDGEDNCPDVSNADQADFDFDGIGDVCDACPVDRENDSDDDSICNSDDNCPAAANTDQANADGDSFGDLCDTCPNDAANDADGDGRCADADNCPEITNADQADADGDGLGDACDACRSDAANDSDGDGVCGDRDNCPSVANGNQEDADADQVGDVCDTCPNDSQNDIDGDGVCGDLDNCPNDPNPDQANEDNDEYGDVCEPPDADNDGILDADDNCVSIANPDQANSDGDAFGDACDFCPEDPTNTDTDADRVCDADDNCPAVFNVDQADNDGDGLGNACDPCPNGEDSDGDGSCDDVDNCPEAPNDGQQDGDGDGIGDACDTCPDDADANADADGDGVCASVDNCPGVSNADQLNGDGDEYGDACDPCINDPDNGDDSDGDGVCAPADNCPGVGNADQADADADGIGDACDACPNDSQNDADGDGVCGDVDNCPSVSNAEQLNSDQDSFGDQCDNCRYVSNPDQNDSNNNDIGDVCATRYFGYTPNETGNIVLTAFDKGTRYAVTDSDGTPVSYGVLVPYGNAYDSNLTSLDAETFIVETETPISVILGYDCCNLWGSTFFTAIDGYSSYGTEFVFTQLTQPLPFWQEFGLPGAKTVLFASEDTSIEIRNSAGDIVDSVESLEGGAFWIPNNLEQGTVYRVSSDADVSIMHNAHNGLTAVPPVPTENDEDNNCNNNSGRLFHFGTHGWERGAVAVFNDGQSESVFSIVEMDGGATLAADVTIGPGDYWYQGGLGYGYYTLEASEGAVAVWSGDTEGGDGVEFMGDDLTMNYGAGSKRFVVHSQAFGAYVFAGSNGTNVTAVGTPEDGQVVELAFPLNDGDTYSLDPFYLWTIESDKPIIVQTYGGYSQNDWATSLFPMPADDGTGAPVDCAADLDEDGVADTEDNCVTVANPDQSDADADGVGDSCDNCPSDFNPGQEDENQNGQGDACTSVGSDSDGDGIDDEQDNCPSVSNADQANEDGDGLGDACDPCLSDPLNGPDPDGDGVCGDTDNCPTVANSDQADDNNNTIGDVCEIDCLDGIDGDRDGVVDEDAGDCDDAIVVTCPADIYQPVLQEADFQAELGANAGLLVHEGWSIVTQPFGSSVTPTPADARSASITPLVAGSYRLRYTATNGAGEVTACEIDYQAWVGDALRIELFWNLNIPEEQDRADMDLHLAHENASAFFDSQWDCYYDNCIGGGLQWGTPVEEDNPRLDVDDTDGWGPENINIEDPELDVNYRIAVHSYSTADLASALVQVRVYCLGELQEELGPVSLNAGGNGNPYQNEMWILGDVRFSGSGCAMTQLFDDDGGPYIVTGEDAASNKGPSCSSDPCFDPSCDGFEPVACGFEGCDNQLDDDNDGLVDCLDSDCWSDSICTDSDLDGVPDVADNCSVLFNPEQVDGDGDGIGDACDECPTGDNDLDSDGDSVANGCDVCPFDADNDADGDTVCGDSDNCEFVPNTDQADLEQDGIGDVCDEDDDNDGVPDTDDNCSRTPNPDQADEDQNGIGDACEEGSDTDADGIEDENDNCVLVYNPDQIDTDGSGGGDACDDDDDGDNVADDVDNCQYTSNPGQEDQDQDGLGDACDDDADGDGVLDASDNCPVLANEDQADQDGDGIGDVCDEDRDGDGVRNEDDNCPWVMNQGQEDADGDGVGDLCDSSTDSDGDLIQDVQDNCPEIANPNQEDQDADGVGDVCDDDIDGDGISNVEDNCPEDANVSQDNNDGDALGDLCDEDDDNDAVPDVEDNCPVVANTDQADIDSDGLGDLCDADLDGDEVNNDIDNCPFVFNAGQADLDRDGLGDPCDADDDNDGVDDDLDNCPLDFNEFQADLDGDGLGDDCDSDDDGDGIDDEIDNCPIDPNFGQEDLDQDEQGDVCDDDLDGDGIPQNPSEADGGTAELDNCPLIANPAQTDSDGDGIGNLCDTDTDRDGDGLDDGIDNCPDIANADQADMDGDGTGDLCDEDPDGDGLSGPEDNCPLVANADQSDVDGDGEGDACDEDRDGDGILDESDNCPTVANEDQADADGDGVGDACDENTDSDGDGLLDNNDNCPQTANPEQNDLDEDEIGDLCDPDDDNDTFVDDYDNCPQTANADQSDIDSDGLGDACDEDADGDGIVNTDDNCKLVPNTEQTDADGDGRGDSCDADIDDDGIGNPEDNCPRNSNADQADVDQDGIGDACDTNTDSDGDGIDDGIDNCVTLSNPEQLDLDADGIGNLCDDDLDGDGLTNELDNCVSIPNFDQSDSNGNGIGDACDEQTGNADGGTGDGTDGGMNGGGSNNDSGVTNVQSDAGSQTNGSVITAGDFYDATKVVVIAAPGCGCDSGAGAQGRSGNEGAYLLAVFVLMGGLLRRRSKR